jgi:flavin reductase (DIM6/NTAB) family NADH-FMN oxidoreductase RutF
VTGHTLDPATYRAVLGRLASGVSIVTTVSEDGRDHGMTVSALSSLSLTPPLIILCVDLSATMHPHLMAARHFAVSILALAQEQLSRRFAASLDDRFDGVAITRDSAGCALISDALAHLECRMWAQYPGGDHTIFVGQVLRAAVREAHPLIYYRGAYARLDE